MHEFTELLSAVSFDQLFSLLVRFSASVDAEQILFAIKHDKMLPNEEAIILSTYPKAWRERYDEVGYASIDPVVHRSFTSTLPIPWTNELYQTPEQHAFHEEAQAFGLSHGITFPMHGPGREAGMFSIRFPQSDTSTYEKTVRRHIEAAGLLRDYAFSSSTALLTCHDVKKAGLTRREYEVLSWCAAGKTTWETSIILSCSESTVNFHMKNINRKYGTNTRRMAVIKAIQYGDISAPT